MKSGFLWILKALLSHYWQHPWQTLFLSIGLVAGVGLWSAVQIINQHAEASYQDAQNLLGAQANYWVRNRRGEGIEQALYIELRRDGYRQVFPVIELNVSTRSGIALSLIATDILALPGDGAEDDEDFTDNWLEFIQPPYRAWVPAVLAAELGLAEGERLLLRDGRMLPPAMIQSREQQGRRIFIDIGAALSLSGSDQLSYLAVGDISASRANSLRAKLPPHLELVENQQHIDLQELTASLHTHLTAMSLLSFAVGLFIVFNAVRFSLWYRRATLLNLRLMGCANYQLFGAILFETLMWSVLGTALGLILGILLAHLLLPGLGASLQSLYDATVDVEIGLNLLTVLKAWCITLFGLILALAWPLYRQIQLSTLDAARTETELRDESVTRRWLALIAMLLMVTAVVAYERIETVTQGFIVLGMLLIAAAWLLPILLAFGLRVLASLVPQQQLMARWMVADGWSQLPAFRAAMMAMLLALTANLGVGTLVDSFRHAFVNWLDLRQSADIYVLAQNMSEQQLLNSPANDTWLTAIHNPVGVTIRWRERATLVRGIDPAAPDSQELPLSLWQGETAEAARATWREQKGKALINEQAHFLGGIDVGDAISLETDIGVQQYEVVGVFYDYGNPYYQIYLPTEVVQRNWQYYYSRGFGLWLNKNNPEAVQQAEATLSSLGAQPGDWILQQQIRDLSVGIFDRTFAITAAMNGLTMIVAAIALLASLLAILHERLPQFAQWRALGLRQREQLLLIATPLLIFCAIAWTLSIPLGALLSWILIHKLNIISFGWSMPLVWEFTPALNMALIVIAICAATLLMVAYQWRRDMPRALAELGETL